jgi:hypothetical protein
MHVLLAPQPHLWSETRSCCPPSLHRWWRCSTTSQTTTTSSTSEAGSQSTSVPEPCASCKAGFCLGQRSRTARALGTSRAHRVKAIVAVAGHVMKLRSRRRSCVPAIVLRSVPGGRRRAYAPRRSHGLTRLCVCAPARVRVAAGSRRAPRGRSRRAGPSATACSTPSSTSGEGRQGRLGRDR